MTSNQHLQKQFTTFEKQCDGKLGINAIHIETQREISYNTDQLFLMCSTYKLPMAIYLMHKVECGEMSLTDSYTVTEFDHRPGAVFTLNEFDCSTGFPISLRNLLQLLLQESCNTSTDILLRLIGGPAAVTAYLRTVGIKDMRVDRYMIEILADSDGVTTLPRDHRITPAQYKALELAVDKEVAAAARKRFLADPQDKATPSSMTQLLIKLFKNELLQPENSDLLLKLMRRNKLYPNRLMGLLPAKTPVAHKTGTGMSCFNDVGIITLPHHAGHVAITAFISQSNKEKPINERTLAEAARTVYDYFLLHE